MNKKNKLIIAGVIGIVILGTGSFFIYSNSSTNKMAKKGTELMTEKEYNKSISAFDLVLDDKPNDKEVLESKDMVEKYLGAKKLFDEGKTEEANKEVKEISKNYLNINGFNKDVDSLTNKIDESMKADTEMSKNIVKIRALVKVKKYDESKKLIDQLGKEKLSEIQTQQIEDLKSVINSELSRIEYENKAKLAAKAESEAKKKATVLNNSNNNTTNTVVSEAKAYELVMSVPHLDNDTKLDFNGIITIESSSYIPAEARGKSAYSFDENDESTQTSVAGYYVDMQGHVYRNTASSDGKCIKLR